MRELSVQEILEYAVSVEEESFRFYSAAAEHLADEQVKELASDLAAQEVGHANHLRHMLHEKTLSVEEQARKLGIDAAVTPIVQTVEITADSKPQEVLQIALGREQNTLALYTTLLNFTDLNQALLNIFEELRDQEADHARRIEARLAKLTS